MESDNKPPQSRGEKIIGYIGLTIVLVVVLYLIALFLIWLTGKALS